jgi:hypothetical protein
MCWKPVENLAQLDDFGMFGTLVLPAYTEVEIECEDEFFSRPRGIPRHRYTPTPSNAWALSRTKQG